jgi:hypothetical protein
MRPGGAAELPEGLEIVGNMLTPSVRLRGLSGALSRMVPGDMAAVICRGAAGAPPVPATPGQGAVPSGMEAVQVGPSTLTMEFETSGCGRCRWNPT